MRVEARIGEAKQEAAEQGQRQAETKRGESTIKVTQACSSTLPGMDVAKLGGLVEQRFFGEVDKDQAKADQVNEEAEYDDGMATQTFEERTEYAEQQSTSDLAQANDDAGQAHVLFGIAVGRQRFGVGQGRPVDHTEEAQLNARIAEGHTQQGHVLGDQQLKGFHWRRK